MTIPDLRTTIELQSLAFTAPLLVLALLVVIEALPALMAAPRYTPIWWMTLGIILGFVGGFSDSFYWSFPWSSHYLDLRIAQALNENGVFSNIIFRQLFGILSAYCHIRAFVAPEKGGFNRNRLMRLVHCFTLSALGVGQLYVFCLYYIKHH
jgi:hypothetical protein